MILLAGLSFAVIKEIEVTYFDHVKSVIENFWSSTKTFTVGQIGRMCLAYAFDFFRCSFKRDSSHGFANFVLGDDATRNIGVRRDFEAMAPFWFGEEVEVEVSIV